MPDAPGTATGGSAFIDRAYGLDQADRNDDARALYDEWADTYDAEVQGPEQGYVAHQRVAETVARVAGIDGAVLDAGAGTGLVGAALAELGAPVIDGIDLSPGMLARARATGAYRTLTVADLNEPIALDDEVYDTVVSAGTFTHGHVGPAALRELLRVLRPGGVLVATVLDDIWLSGGYAAEVEELAGRGVAEVVSTDLADYRASLAVTARMVVLRRR